MGRVAMTIAVDLRQRLGAFHLDVRFSSEGRLTALFGRSGSGKTSLVNLICGLGRPDRGRVVIDGEVLVDTEAAVFVPKHRRRVGYVFQEGRLFPHLTVRQNLLYGHWFAPRAGRYVRLQDVIGLLGIGHLLARSPSLLSGGEKQRVAIGRALLTSPRLLLMDEPLASLDETRKAEILPYIERLRDETGIPIVYVSHSIPEVVRLAHTVVVMSEGRVVAAGPTAEVMSRVDLYPLTGRGEAGAVLEAVVKEHDVGSGLTALASRAGILRVPRLELAAGQSVRVRVRARDVMIATDLPTGLSALNILPCRVAEIGPDHGAVAEVALDCNGERLVARLTLHSIGSLGLVPGRAVFAVIKSVAFDRHSLGGITPAFDRADAEVHEP
jgi:molybdate transport system ATP-binding protein